MTLAESYYEVANDLERQARYMLDVAKTLNQIANQMSEAQILAKAKADQGKGEG